MSVLPAARGPLSTALLRVLSGDPPARGEGPDPTTAEGIDLCDLRDLDVGAGDALADEDLQLALYLAYELHYRGLSGVGEDWEWQPELLAFRGRLESAFEGALSGVVAPAPPDINAAAELWDLAHRGDGPSLSGYMAERGTLEEMRELCIHRSAYQLKEADPHTWAIPRIGGRAKAAMVEIQNDEYGGGRAEETHAALFAVTLRELGLDDTYGAYLDAVPAVTLATVNLISMLGLHRRWRGALVGHLALFEMTSVGPMGRYSAALRRLGLPARARRFYDVHVLADAHHENVALDVMVPGLLAEEPELAGDVVTGARWLTELEARFTRRVLGSWAEGRSSLHRPAGRDGADLRVVA